MCAKRHSTQCICVAAFSYIEFMKANEGTRPIAIVFNFCFFLISYWVSKSGVAKAALNLYPTT